MLMKIRASFVTNSSSSSFICCLAKVSDKEKAQVIIDKYELDVYTGKELKEEYYIGNVDWAGVWINKSKLNEEDIYVYYDDFTDIEENEDNDYDFEEENHSPLVMETIDSISENNGFTNIDVQCGAGRNG
jgi:hypothetical protein